MRKILLISAVCMLINSTFGSELNPAGSDDGAKEYQQGYRFVLNAQWAQARKIFKELIEKYPESAWVDDSRFWLCYIFEKNDDDPAAAFECYQDFVKRFEDSKWADDATSNMIRLARELEKQGNPEYMALVESQDYENREQITEAAIQALQGRGDDKAFEVLSKLYDQSSSASVKRKIIYVFGTMDSKAAYEKMKSIAREGTQSDLRAEAVFWIGQQSDSPEVVEYMEQIISNDPDYSVKKKALFSIAQMEQQAAHQAMMRIAKSGDDDALRAEAVFWLGQSSGDDKTLEFLKTLVKKDKSSKVRKKAIFALSQFSDGKGFPYLVELARSAGDDEMREDAVFWISQSNKAAQALDVLKDLAMNDPVPAIQKKAIFSISQLSGAESFAALKEIARKHGSTALRKDAVFWISQIDDAPERLEFLKKIALTDPDPDVMEKALFAMSQIEDENSIDALIDVAKNHPLLQIRKKAIFWLGQSDDPRAKEAIEKVLFNEDE